jgi:5'-3' exonuclease|tara:strand:- start:688 stop:1524 length:837 start_codon:yes stop_codon:yes gene_type:complete
MILIDNNQVVLSSIFAQTRGNKDLDEDQVRHITLNIYRSIRNKFYSEYGELIICQDSSNCWRKDIFPQYKAGRKKNQQKDAADWNKIFDVLGTIRREIRETFPYKNISIPRCEADDIIAVLAKKYSPSEKVVIVSSDKDFKQLQRFDNVKQYCLRKKDFLVEEDPERFLFDHIMYGDSSDGIPNVLSADTVFVDGIRQRPISKKKLEKLYRQEEDLGVEFERNWDRNSQLVDLDRIPEKYVTEILEAFEESPIGARSNIFNYFVSNKLRMLMENIQDF